MSNVSLKVVKNGTRGNTKPGECIALKGPLHPDGATGIKYGTNMNGGDGSLEFTIGDRKQIPAQKNDAAEVQYGLERVTQHSIFDIQKNELDGSLAYAGQGHGAHYEKSIILRYTAPLNRYVTDYVDAVVYGAYWDAGEGWAGSNKAVPFLNASKKYAAYAAGGAGDNPLLYNTGYDLVPGEQIMSDMLKYCDYVRGIFPGREPHPDNLGCFFYWKTRTAGQSVKWLITREDLQHGQFGVVEDMSQYCNRAFVKYKYNAGGDITALDVDDVASQNLYTPGSYEEVILDLTSYEGYLDSAAATAAGLAYLAVYAKPIMKGSLTIPLAKIARIGRGRQWAGLIRGGDIIKVERDEYRTEGTAPDGYNTLLVDSTMVDIDAWTQTLTMPNPASMEMLLCDALAAA